MTDNDLIAIGMLAIFALAVIDRLVLMWERRSYPPPQIETWTPPSEKATEQVEWPSQIDKEAQ